MTAKEYLKENDIWSTTLEDLKIVDVSGHKFSVDYLMEQYANEKVKEETEKDKEFAFDLWTQCVDKNERIQELEEENKELLQLLGSHV